LTLAWPGRGSLKATEAAVYVAAVAEPVLIIIPDKAISTVAILASCGRIFEGFGIPKASAARVRRFTLLCLHYFVNEYLIRF
jgi:hypothetical protein